MVTLDWDVDRADGVTFVRVYVTASQPRRVRVEHRLDGPVWPPRRRGQVVAGWEEDGFEGVVDPDDRLVTGYASPATPEDPPVELVSDEPADATAETTPNEGFETAVGAVESSPAGVVRSLGDPVVPRDAVPVPETGGADNERAPPTPESPSDDGESVEATSASADERSEQEGEPSPSEGVEREATAATETPDGELAASDTWSSEQSGPRGPDATLVVPGAVRAWLADVERRVAAVERHEQVDSASALGTAVAGDRQALARVARRVTTLTERVDGLGGLEPGDESRRETPQRRETAASEP